MFVAAVASEAVIGTDIGTVLDVGASVVPAGSRMAEAIRLVPPELVMRESSAPADTARQRTRSERPS